MKTAITKLNPANLKNHPLNSGIYGSAPEDEFVELVREHGIHDPIMVTTDNVIVSGHRRNQAAKICGMKEVPVLIIMDKLDPLEIEKLLILSNKQREKTNEMKLREYERLKEIEEQRAAGRKKAGLKKGDTKESPVVENLPPRENLGKSRDLAAKEVGMSGRNAETGVKVLKKIDELKAEGKTEKAAELTADLNKSVSGAAKKISEPKKPTKPKFDEKSLDDLLGKLVRKIDERLTFVNSKKGHAVCISKIKELDKALKTWRAEG